MTTTVEQLHPLSVLAISETPSLSVPLDCHLLFVEQLPGAVILDAVTAAGAGIAKSGTPFTVEAALPWSKWRIVALAVLERWVADGREVRLQFLRKASGYQVRVSNGDTWTLLDVRALHEA